jgi:hypothetical protein
MWSSLLEERRVKSSVLGEVCGSFVESEVFVVLCWMCGAWNPLLEVKCVKSSIECEMCGVFYWM